MQVGRSIDRMERMISNLLDLSRMNALQQLPLQLGECTLDTLVRDLATELAQTYACDFQVHTPDDLRGIWSGEDLRRALWNLGSNAAKYGSEGRPVQIVLEPRAAGVRISVNNQGPVINAAEQSELFEPFSRATNAQTSRTSGWGLGLFLVRACAEAHGGHVSVCSDPQSGTTFTVELPWDARPFQNGGGRLNQD